MVYNLKSELYAIVYCFKLLFCSVKLSMEKIDSICFLEVIFNIMYFMGAHIGEQDYMCV